MLTDEDDVIRLQDIPERMQLAHSTLSSSFSPLAESTFSDNNLIEAAEWVTLRLSDRHEADFFRPDGQHRILLPGLISAVREAIRLVFIDHLEVPYIWAHKRDHINHFDVENPSYRVEFLNRVDLWKIYSLGRKYRALLDRKKILEVSYQKLQVKDDYFETRLRDELDSVESVADTTEWLGMKYRNRKKDDFQFQFHDDEEPETQKRKLPTRTSDYDLVKQTI